MVINITSSFSWLKKDVDTSFHYLAASGFTFEKQNGVRIGDYYD